MAKLIIRRGESFREVDFIAPMQLRRVLEAHGAVVIHPCGGRGTCGKCAVELKGMVSPPNAAEIAAGMRLSCQAELLGDAEVILPELPEDMQVETAILSPLSHQGKMQGPGVAIDIGTTTIAMTAHDLATGKILCKGGMLNPQTEIAADVMGRIGAALEGKSEIMQKQVEDAILSLLQDVTPDSMVITGNTTMLYLLTGRNPDCLSHAPFQADELFGISYEIAKSIAYLPRCMNAFVGADITCAVLASGMCEKEEASLLCDIGTNGEIALWKDGKLYVTSTAAGPAFEGAGISCGCGSIPGAIDKVWVENGKVKIHTIGEATATGLCGSGVIDTIAALLETEDIDETGAMDEDSFTLAENVEFLPKDVRAVQLAKAAIAAGIKTLLSSANVSSDEIETLYIAGGFGSHLNVESGVRIGLIPEELADKVKIIGNASLAGAAQILLNPDDRRKADAIALESEHVNLGGNPLFNENYMEEMFFPEE